MERRVRRQALDELSKLRYDDESTFPQGTRATTSISELAWTICTDSGACSVGSSTGGASMARGSATWRVVLTASSYNGNQRIMSRTHQ